jgi:hypothetical protein
MVIAYGIKIPGIHVQYQNIAQYQQYSAIIDYETVGQIYPNTNGLLERNRMNVNAMHNVNTQYEQYNAHIQIDELLL